MQNRISCQPEVKTIIHRTPYFNFAFLYCESTRRETITFVTRLAAERVRAFNWNDAVIVCNKIREGVSEVVL